MVEKVNDIPYENLSQNDKILLNDAEILQQEVLERLRHSVSKYGAAYTLADIEQELDSEILDIVGWPLLMAVRMRQILSKRLSLLNNEYLDKFLAYNDSEYLKLLRVKIDKELEKRNA